jgi:hypothetical protein
VHNEAHGNGLHGFSAHEQSTGALNNNLANQNTGTGFVAFGEARRTAGSKDPCSLLWGSFLK